MSLVILAILTAPYVGAQLQKDTVVASVAPCNHFDDGSVVTDAPGGGVLVDGKPLPAWTAGAWAEPCLNNIMVVNIKTAKDGSAVEVELRGNTYGPFARRSRIRLLFQTANVEDAFAQLFISATDQDRVRRMYATAVRENEAALKRARAEAAKEVFLESAFVGPLDAVPAKHRGELVEFLYGDEAVQRWTIAAQTFKDRSYFVLDFGHGGMVYNDDRLSQPQRLALLLNDHLLAAMRFGGRMLEGTDAFHGLKTQALIPHRGFVSETAAQYDVLEIYSPMDLIRQFSAADITARKLLDGSVILVNGNRTEVPSDL